MAFVDSINGERAAPPKKNFTIDLNGPECVILSFVFWDLFFGIPISYIITALTTLIVRFFGYEDFMGSFCGTLSTRMLFVTINIQLLVRWDKKMTEGLKRKRVEAEIKFWDAQIERLERERVRVEEIEIMNQFLRERRLDRELTVPSVMGGDREAWERSAEKNSGKVGVEMEVRRVKTIASKTMRQVKVEREEL